MNLHYVMCRTERPHNPMVNAGAIVTLSLLLNLSEVDMTLAEKFDWVMNYFKVSRSGGATVGRRYFVRLLLLSLFSISSD